MLLPRNRSLRPGAGKDPTDTASCTHNRYGTGDQRTGRADSAGDVAAVSDTRTDINPGGNTGAVCHGDDGARHRHTGAYGYQHGDDDRGTYGHRDGNCNAHRDGAAAHGDGYTHADGNSRADRNGYRAGTDRDSNGHAGIAK